MNDHEVAAWLAERAGRILMLLRDGPLEPVPLGYVADQTANGFLMSALKMLRPEDRILSEESPDDLDRLAARRVWIIDPLDGTREYAQGRSDWAVHVALTVDGAPVAGAVAQPAAGRIAATPHTPPLPRREPRPIMVVSRTRAPAGAVALADALGAELHELGSAGAKAMAVIAGEADLYFHTGGQHEWDNCAPVAVALAAGLMACRIDGSPIRYNQADVKVPDLLIAEPAIGERALAVLRGGLG
jgi:3'(2'), 5'-bisphosphate nucleotidase